MDERQINPPLILTEGGESYPATFPSLEAYKAHRARLEAELAASVITREDVAQAIFDELKRQSTKDEEPYVGGLGFGLDCVKVDGQVDLLKIADVVMAILGEG
jgi:hypothetical protein